MISVLIIGAGPVGLSLALALAKFGIHAHIIEERPGHTHFDESRAITWMPKGLEFLQWLGILEAFQAAGQVRTKHEFRHRGNAVFTLDFRLVKSPFRYTLQLPQGLTESILEQLAIESPFITMERQKRLVALHQNKDHVSATIQDVESGTTEEYRAYFLAACDGAKSTTRNLLQIKLQWKDYGTYSAVADFDGAVDQDPAISWIELDQKRPYGLFHFHPNRWRFIYRINAGEDKDKMSTRTAAESLIRQKLPGATIERLLWSSSFRLGQGQAERYAENRCVLVGDAAHPMGPSAGAGMMVGILGVWRLAWRLARLVKDQRGEDRHSFLLAYEEEQRLGSRSIQEANEKTFRNIALADPLKAAVRVQVLKLLNQFTFVKKKMILADTLTDQRIEVHEPFNPG